MIFDKEIVKKLDKISDLQVQHTIQLARNTEVLDEHHVRASNLEARFKPVENHVLVVNSVVKIFLTILGAGGTLAGILHYLLPK